MRLDCRSPLLTGSLILTTAIMAASAAPGRAESLVISPLRVEMSGVPGGVYSGAIHASVIKRAGQATGLSATRPEKARLQVLIRDWDMAADGTMSYSTPGSTPGSCASWVTLSARSIDVKAGDTAEIAYHVRIPRETPDGDYRAVIFFKTGATAGPERTGVQYSAAVGAILYITVGSPLKKACITGLTATARGMVIVIRNETSSLLRISGKLTIDDAAGKKLLEISAPAAVLLPGAGRLRDIQAPFPPGFHLAGGRYRLTAILDYGADTLMGARTTFTIPAG